MIVILNRCVAPSTCTDLVPRNPFPTDLYAQQILRVGETFSPQRGLLKEAIGKQCLLEITCKDARGSRENGQKILRVKVALGINSAGRSAFKFKCCRWAAASEGKERRGAI